MATKRILRRRAATAAGLYGSVAFGVVGTLIAARALGTHDFGVFAIVLAATSFCQILLDLTVEEALVKYGFRYATSERYGLLHSLFKSALVLKVVGGIVAAVALAILAPFSESLFGDDMLVPLLLAALIPPLQAPEAVAGTALLLRGRYDLRAGFIMLAQALRLLAIVVGTQFGVAETVLGFVLAQALATAALGTAGWFAFRRFPAVAPEPLTEDRRDLLRFVLQSSLATGVVSMRVAVGPVLLGAVSSPAQAGYFRIALTPQQGLGALTSPARLILLTEQTRDWERGRSDAVFASVRRWTVSAAAVMLVTIPIAYWLMPDLVRIGFGEEYAPAVEAARLILVAGAIQFVIAWTKSLPFSIGRPALRIWTHGIETIVFVPLVVVLGARWDVTGAGVAVLVSTIVFAAAWAVALARVRREPALRTAVAP